MLYPACGAALGCLWVPFALLLALLQALFARGEGTRIILPEKYTRVYIITLEPHQFRDITASGTLASLVYMILLIDDV